MDQIDFYRAKLAYETDAWDLFDDLKQGKPVVVVDARSEAAFAKEHIPGAVNIPHKTMSQLACAHLSPDITYVTYCDGIGCNARANASNPGMVFDFQSF